MKPDLSHIETPEGSKAVPLSQGKYALVDDEDYDRVMEYNWYLTKGGYAYNRNMGYMHRFIMNTPDGMQTDHINGTKYDNRRKNLRVCTSQENTWNSKSVGATSSFKGVAWDREQKKWRAQITINGKPKKIGRFEHEEEAARAYNEVAKEYRKTFAKLNNL